MQRLQVCCYQKNLNLLRKPEYGFSFRTMVYSPGEHIIQKGQVEIKIGPQAKLRIKLQKLTLKTNKNKKKSVLITTNQTGFQLRIHKEAILRRMPKLTTKIPKIIQ